MKRTEKFHIVYEDDQMVVVNKSSGIAILADRWDDSKERLDELMNALYAKDAEEAALAKRQPKIAFPHRVWVVHRIDRDTSGLLVFAKTAAAHRFLSEAFETRNVEKTYIAVVHGRPAWTDTDCTLPLRMDGDKEHRTIIDKAMGKRSVTRFKYLGGIGNFAVIEAKPETGRTHQIRIHLTTLGHPIVCDSLYGSPKPVLLSAFKRGYRGDPYEEKPLLSRLGLHAYEISLPKMDVGAADGAGASDDERLKFKAELPRDMAALINQMEKCSGEDFQLRAK
ncbi:RluA family pseudouridine synthase [Treponema sp.]